ncbi:MAG: NADH-quinone oxidoreductase subunit NuoH [Omnitrophica WOR_2 bacterium]
MSFLNDPINFIANWLNGLFISWGLSTSLTNFILVFLGVLISASALMVLDIMLVWVERKTVARLQDRVGPNRLGPFGLFQPLADIIKLLIKEDITPDGADRILYNLAPIFGLGTVLLLWAVIPFGPRILGSDINIGILFIVAVGALGTLGIIMAGWASNNKYALLGALRMVAQMISFEVPMVISLLVPVILASSMGINTIIKAQSVWFVFLAPITMLIFLTTAQAELGRAPFDLAEGESEIVAGFHIEYTGMKFGMFYAGELLHALTFGVIISALFLGGWRGPGAETYPFLGVLYLFAKAFIFYFVIMWVKYSFPRVRIDQMLNFNWKFLTPLSLAVVIMTATLDKVLALSGITLQSSPWIYTGVFLLANILLGGVTVFFLQRRKPASRPVVGQPRPVAVAPEVPLPEIH